MTLCARSKEEISAMAKRMSQEDKTRNGVTREERAERAFRTLPNSELNSMSEEDRATTFVDLVTDLLHRAYQYGVEPDYVIHTAQMHYQAEVDEKHHAESLRADQDPDLLPAFMGGHPNGSI